MNERLKIAVNTGGKVFFYKGYIQKEQDGFIYFIEDSEGEIRFNKQYIIYMSPNKHNKR